MKIENLATFSKMKEDIENMRLLVNAVKELKPVGISTQQIEEYEDQINGLDKQLFEYKETIELFNSTYSSFGWIAHDYFSFDIMKEANRIAQNKATSEGQQYLVDKFCPDEIELKLVMLKGSEEINHRYKFIEYAFNDYKNGRYYACIPILLMVIDGSVCEYFGKGFHCEDVDLDVWDSITSIDNGLNVLRSIFMKGRKQTREEKIDMPYRNGILHGMDLGYDNCTVAAKCWHYLFVIRDWLVSKKYEEERKQKYLDGRKTPTIEEILKTLKDNEKMKSIIADWENGIRLECKISKKERATEFLDYLKLKNYGKMFDLYWVNARQEKKYFYKMMHEMYDDLKIETYSITKVDEVSSGIAEIEIDINGKSKYSIRMICQDSNGEIVPCGFDNSEWKIVYMKIL